MVTTNTSAAGCCMRRTMGYCSLRAQWLGDNTVVHGVSEMVSGGRYGLYFLSRV